MVAILDTTEYLAGDVIDAYVHEQLLKSGSRGGDILWCSTNYGNFLNQIDDNVTSWTKIVSNLFKRDKDILSRKFVLFSLNMTDTHFGLAAIVHPQLVINPDLSERPLQPCIIFMDPFDPKILDVSKH